MAQCWMQRRPSIELTSVNYSEMIKRKIPPLVIRLIMEMYEKQRMAVRWNNEYSDSFGVSNGVKQGGLLSPILFCIYIDNMLMSLTNIDIGCHVGSHFCRAFGYADDIMLSYDIIHVQV